MRPKPEWEAQPPAADSPARDGPLKVVVGSTQSGWHGGEEQLRLLAVGLRRRGHDCFVFAREGAPLSARMSDEGFEVLTFRGHAQTPRAIARIRAGLKRIGPQIVHSNDGNAMAPLALASVGLAIPAHVVSRRVDFPIRSTWRYNLLADRLLCVSTAVADACRASGITAGSIRVVHDGVDPTRIRSGNRERGRRAIGCEADSPLLLCVAKLGPPKGHRFLLDAMPTVLARFPGAILVLAGEGELRKKLERQSTRLGIGEHVRFLGYRPDVPDLMAAADLVVISSITEGLCTSVIDAMYARRTLVVTSAGGLTDLTGETFEPEPPIAWTAPSADSGALADAITEALSASDEERRTRQDRAERRAQRLFTADRMVEGTLRAYREVIRAKGAAEPAPGP